MGLVQGVFFYLVVYWSKFGCVSSQEDMLQDVKIRHYFNGKTPNYKEYFLNETTAMISHPMFRLDCPTVLYIHGWNQIVNEDKTLSRVVNAYLQRNDHNVLILNYEKLAAKLYPIAVNNVPALGEKVALALLKCFEKGLNPSRIHLLGFSLGAPISAEIGRSTKRAGITLPRITGLDPAHLLYYTGNNTELNKNDASFVVIIHSDAGWLGGPTSSGHADFWPNKGTRPQPMCGNSLWQFMSVVVFDHCAHDASVHYLADSVIDEKKFPATSRLDPSTTALMGYACSPDARGDYDLTTE